MPLPGERGGGTLRISGQRVAFSYWPTSPGQRGQRVQPQVLSSSPWDVIEYAIKRRYAPRSLVAKACLAFLNQARAFYFAAETQDDTASPLLLYYSFLNIAKCFILFKSVATNVDNAEHGLTVQRHSAAITGAVIVAFKATARNTNIFDLFGQALGLPAFAVKKKNFRVIKHIIPQIVIGHRLWMSASNKSPKFIPCDGIDFRRSSKNKQVWLRIRVTREDFRSSNLSHKKLLRLAGLQSTFREVAPLNEKLAQTSVVLEQIDPTSYTRRPSDKLLSVAGSLKHELWPIVRSVPPYRRYYLNLMSPVDRRLQSILAAYLFSFYLGSVTRYRPFDFAKINDSKYGMFVAEYIETQGQQFWYQMASEFLEQNVSLPAVLH